MFTGADNWSATVGIISDVLMDLNPQYPTVAPEVKAKLGEMKKQLEAELPHETGK